MPKIRFPLLEESGFSCLGIDTAQISGFELDSEGNLNLFFREEIVILRKADLKPDIFSSLLAFVIAEFPHIDDVKLSVN